MKNFVFDPQIASKANLIVFSSNINLCGKAALWQQATDFLRELHQKSLEANLVASTAAISALERAAEMEFAPKAHHVKVTSIQELQNCSQF